MQKSTNQNWHGHCHRHRLCFSHRLHWGAKPPMKKMRKTKPMAMAMPMPILIGTFWYFFQKGSGPSSLGPSGLFQMYVRKTAVVKKQGFLCNVMSLIIVRQKRPKTLENGRKRTKMFENARNVRNVQNVPFFSIFFSPPSMHP